MHVDTAILSRKSVRRFLPDAIPRETIEHILKLAAQAPSGGNIQPWHVQVMTGDVKTALCTDIYETADKQGDEHRTEFDYYPTNWFEPYQGRRRETGYALYEKLGIQRQDWTGRKQQMLRNYLFFDAPVGILVSANRLLGTGIFLDVGMFIQNITLAARGQGLHTCVQNALADYHQVIRRHLPIDDEDWIVCGISLGYEDTHAPENDRITGRADIHEFAAFNGFDGASSGDGQR